MGASVLTLRLPPSMPGALGARQHTSHVRMKQAAQQKRPGWVEDASGGPPTRPDASSSANR
ncbi:unnamed protein product [Caretta caretta]